MYKALFYLLSLSLLAACAPKPSQKTTTVKFKLPESTGKSALKHYRTANSFGLNDINNLDNVDCYAIIAEYDKDLGYCESSDGTSALHANEIFGTFPTGEEVSVEVLSERNVTFHIIALNNSSAICPNFRTFSPAQRAVSSKPVLVGSASKFIGLEETTVEVNISLSGSTQLETCQDFPFEWNIGGIAQWDHAQWDSGVTWGP